MKLPLSDLARAMGASPPLGGEATGYSIDSRTLSPGDLFFALGGEVNDGHRFVPDVLRHGAATAVVEKDVAGCDGLLRVPDVGKALQAAAVWARKRWGGTVVAVTGSAGKTTTKDVIAALLGTAMLVGRTTGNYNNHLGLPLSILRIPDEAKAAVLELGMNHTGEIRALAEIAKPNIGVVTNVGYAHLENFADGIDGVALAKRELVEALRVDGTAILNADDERVRGFHSAHPGRTITFGLSEQADIRAEEVEVLEHGVRFRVGKVRLESALFGHHGIRNILAALGVAKVFDIPVSSLANAVRDLQPGKMRGQRLLHNGITIFDDCYNSNPDAARGMLEVLRDTPARRRIAVLGEMLELGRWSEPLHREVGSYAARCGVTVLVGIRGVARSMVQSAIEQGMGEDAAFFFDEPRPAGTWLRTVAQSGDALLFKGSRGTRVEKALETFLEAEPQ